MKTKFFLTGLLSLILLPLANAEVYTLEAGFSGENRGAFNSTTVVQNLSDRWKVQDGNYQIRSIGAFGQAIEVTRNYHIFDIPSFAANEVVTGVKISFPHPGNSYDSPDATETLELFDIDPANFAAIRVTSKDNPSDPNGTAPFEIRDISTLDTIYNDLGTGVSYGTVTSRLSDNGTLQAITNTLLPSLADTLTIIGQAGGGDFGIGGSINSNTQNSGNTIERIFRGSANFANLSSLEITTSVGPVPVPAAVWLYLLETGM